MVSRWNLSYNIFSIVLQLRIYAQPLQIKTAIYAANVTQVVFDYFEDYFNMSYSLPKLGKFLFFIFNERYNFVFSLCVLWKFTIFREHINNFLFYLKLSLNNCLFVAHSCVL